MYARSVLVEFLAGLGKLGDHAVEDFVAGLGGLLDGLAGDVEGKPLDLEIELEPSDALAGAGDLEVHVSKVVLGTEDIGQNNVLFELAVLISLGNETCGDPGHGGKDGHTCIHERQTSAADTCHRGRAVGLHDLGDEADGIGEIVLVRNDWQ